MTWGLIIGAVIVAALVSGYRVHTRDSRHLAGLFAVLAAEYEGELKPATFTALPQLRFERDGRRVLVTAMASSGAQTGDNGPFTVVELVLPFDSGGKVRARRRTGGWLAGQAETGHDSFDAAFRIEWSDPALGARILDPNVRWAMLQPALPPIDVRLVGDKVTVLADGVARSKADLDAMIAIANLVADRSPRH
jgi:hypothetical protein